MFPDLGRTDTLKSSIDDGSLMANPKDMKRQLREEALTMRLKAAEKEMFKNPEVKKMVEDLREMWEEDDDMTVAFAATASSDMPYTPPPKRKPATMAEKANLPGSKIPQLLEMLSNLPAPGQRFINPFRVATNTTANPLFSRNPLRVEARTKAEEELGRTPSAAPEQPAAELTESDRETIAKMEREIQALKIKYRLLKADEELIQSRRGDYAAPANRLKAERLLREIPGTISQLQHRINMMLEGIL